MRGNPHVAKDGHSRAETGNEKPASTQTYDDPPEATALSVNWVPLVSFY